MHPTYNPKLKCPECFNYGMSTVPLSPTQDVIECTAEHTGGCGYWTILEVSKAQSMMAGAR